MTKEEIIAQAKAIISQYGTASLPDANLLIPDEIGKGKLYEAHVLSKVIQHLALDEGLDIRLQQGGLLKLKSAPGPINRAYPYFRLYRANQPVAELWTDVEFLSLSYSASGAKTPYLGDYHELDIIVTSIGASGRPRHDQIWLGVECKNTGYGKSLLKEILGIRRELSFYRPNPVRTRFNSWPMSEVKAEPPSCLLIYATDAAVLNYSRPGITFGMTFVHEPM
jgi:hypothetical protein